MGRNVPIRVKEFCMPLVVEMNIPILNPDKYLAMKFKFKVRLNYNLISKNKQTKYTINNKTIILLIKIITKIAIITLTIIRSLKSITI